MRGANLALPVNGVTPLTRLGGSARSQRPQLPVETRHPQVVNVRRVQCIIPGPATQINSRTMNTELRGLPAIDLALR